MKQHSKPKRKYVRNPAKIITLEDILTRGRILSSKLTNTRQLLNNVTKILNYIKTKYNKKESPKNSNSNIIPKKVYFWTKNVF